MFGSISPAVKNLLTTANEWRAQQTFSRTSGGTSIPTFVKFNNAFSATATATQQVSPAQEWEAQGWKSGSPASSQKVNFRQYLLTFQGSSKAIGNLKIDFSVNNEAYTNILELYTTLQDGINFPYAKIGGAIESSVNNSSTIGTLQNLLLTNPSGSKTNIGFKFGSNIKAGFGVDASGSMDYRGLLHNFFTGSTPDSGIQILQIYNNGIYNNYSAFNGGAVTAGSPDTNATVRLSTYGGFAGKGVLVTSANYTYGDEMVVYGDGSNANLCSGTPNACSTYTTQVNCNAHTGVGCNWNAGSSCSIYNGDSGNCTGTSGCTWESQSCATAGNNTDQSTCENQDDAYGGSCSWDTATCPGLTSQGSCEGQVGCTWTSDCAAQTDQSSCESTSGCTWNFSDCHAFDGTDQSTCEANTGCTWDGGSNVCNGQYNTSCTGGYCSGNLCNGTYNTGNCTGNFGAGCEGTANCNNLTDDGEVTCEAEAGCTWSTGASYTLPTGTVANRGNTSRFYYTKNIGISGNIEVQAGSGDTLESSISIAPGESLLLHHFQRNGNCSDFGTETPCNAQSPCSWLAAVVCSSYGNESECNSAGCTWDGSSCSGAGSPAQCTGGTYAVSKKWYKLANF